METRKPRPRNDTAELRCEQETVSQTTTTAHDQLWTTQFAKLIAFHAQHGHFRVPVQNIIEKQLCQWVFQQRRKQRLGTLQSDRMKRLDEIGFNWDAQDIKTRDAWLIQYNKLHAFRVANGNFQVPVREDKKLSFWVHTQRKQYRVGTLDNHRRALLDEIGFNWDVNDPVGLPRRDLLENTSQPEIPTPVADKWYDTNQAGLPRHDLLENTSQSEIPTPVANESEAALTTKRFQEEDDSVALPYAYGAQHKRQRQSNPHASFLNDAVATIDTVELRYKQEIVPKTTATTTVYDQVWTKQYTKLIAFHGKHEPFHQKSVRKAARAALCQWVYEQRRKQRLGTLLSDRKKRLDDIGFRWDTQIASGMSWFRDDKVTKSSNNMRLLQEIEAESSRKQNCGHGPQRQPHFDAIDDGVALPISLPNAEEPCEIGTAPQTTTVLDQRWTNQYTHLIAFYGKHGHFEVPFHNTTTATLGGWVYHQRRNRRLGTLLSDRKKRLDEIGFDWDAQKTTDMSERHDDKRSKTSANSKRLLNGIEAATSRKKRRSHEHSQASREDNVVAIPNTINQAVLPRHDLLENTSQSEIAKGAALTTKRFQDRQAQPRSPATVGNDAVAFTRTFTNNKSTENATEILEDNSEYGSSDASIEACSAQEKEQRQWNPRASFVPDAVAIEGTFMNNGENVSETDNFEDFPEDDTSDAPLETVKEEGERIFWHDLEPAGWYYEAFGDSWRFFAKHVDISTAMRGNTFFESYEAIARHVRKHGVDSILERSKGRSIPAASREQLTEVSLWLRSMFDQGVVEEAILLRYDENLVDWGLRSAHICQDRLKELDVSFLRKELGIATCHGKLLMSAIQNVGRNINTIN